MKATGIIRRTDDLGRIVIPRDIRQMINLECGDPLEIFIDGEDTVCFRKYKTSLIKDVDFLRDKIIDNYDLAIEAQKKIKNLFNEVHELIKDEE